MKKVMGTLLLFLGSSVFKGFNQSDRIELAKLKASLLYIQSIKTFRLLFISFFSMGICLVFLLVSLTLFHVSLFLYAPWSMETKMVFGLLFSLVYLLVTIGVVYQTLASDKWLRIFHAHTLINESNTETNQDDKIKSMG